MYINWSSHHSSLGDPHLTPPHHLAFLGWQLAVVGVWEGGAGDGLLLCHFYRQLHGSELRQAAAAAEALRGENQVIRRHSSWTGVQWTVPAAAELSAQPVTKNKLHSSSSAAEHAKIQAMFCLCVCVCVQRMSVSRFCSSSCHLTLLVCLVWLAPELIGSCYF